MSISIKQAFIYGLIPFGPIYLRITKFNGSLDHMWTTLPIFQIPILGLIPTMLMKHGEIKKGKLKGSTFDLFVLVTLLLRVIASLLVNHLDEPYASIYNVLLNLIGVMLPFIIRIYSPLCRLCKGNVNQSIDVILKIFSSSAMIMMLIEILSLIVGFIPIFGLIPNFLESIPIIGQILIYAFYFIPLYVVTNIYRENNIAKFCSKKVNKLVRLIIVILPIVIFVFLQKFKFTSG